jgi:hypothetical protein
LVHHVSDKLLSFWTRAVFAKAVDAIGKLNKEISVELLLNGMEIPPYKVKINVCKGDSDTSVIAYLQTETVSAAHTKAKNAVSSLGKAPTAGLDIMFDITATWVDDKAPLTAPACKARFSPIFYFPTANLRLGRRSGLRPRQFPGLKLNFRSRGLDSSPPAAWAEFGLSLP